MKDKPIEDLTYEEALKELESILRSMQSDQCDIDKLSSMTRRATALLASCKQRLTTTETELRQILSSLEEA